MRLPNGAKLIVDGHDYAVKDHDRLSSFDLWVACAEEHNPFYSASADCLTLWCPIDDASPPRHGDLEKAQSCAAFAAGALVAKKDVLITCAMGLNRSALVAGLALRMLDLPGRATVDLLRKMRGKHALNNIAYEQAVLKG